MTRCQSICVLLALCIAHVVNGLPHIVMMLTDDLGYNAPGYNNPDLRTPTLDSLAAGGVKLEHHYVYQFCAPTRASFLTGRFPYHMAATRTNFAPWHLPDGTHLDYTMIPKKLKQANYTTYHVGKWHQGFYTAEYTPVGRGFDHSLGFLEGGEDHMTSSTFEFEAQCTKMDVDLYEDEQPSYGSAGQWTAEIFTTKAVQYIMQHDAAAGPLFLYFALHNTHYPFEVPKRFSDLYHFDDQLRNVFDGMVSAVDESTANVTKALKEKGMWSNTLFIWTTDNGSPVNGAGSNAPLRGGKGSNWEGGTRVPGFVTGGAIPQSMAGKTLGGIMHVCDWYSTFCHLANVKAEDPAGPAPLESINMWPYLTGETDESPRRHVVYDHKMFTNVTVGAIRVGDFKLIVGPELKASWYGHWTPNSSHVDTKVTACTVADPCLFNIKEDPTEHDDLAQKNPEKVKELLAQFKALETQYHPPKNNPKGDWEGYCAAIKQHQGYVAPWRK